jgi:CheY-like chemotaxis protein
VLARLRKTNCCANVAVIVMTSSAAQEDRAQAMSLQVQAYFQKPNNYNEFLKLGELIKLALARNSRHHL